MKVCRTCTQEKPLTEFRKFARSEDGLNSQCKLCVKEYMQDYYQRNKDKLVERAKKRARDNAEEVARYQKEYRQKNREALAAYEKERMQNPEVRARSYASTSAWAKRNPEKRLASSARRRALITNLPTEELDLEELKKRDTSCYLCGVEFQSGDTLHLDHIIPLSRSELSPSHTYENCSLTHSHCNLKKNKQTPDEYWLSNNVSWKID